MKMRPTLVYLAGPIDSLHTPGDEHHLWRREAAYKLYLQEIHVYSPVHAFNPCLEETDANDVVVHRVPMSRELFQSVSWINRAAIDRCDAVLGYLPPGVPAIGTAREIERAIHVRKPVYLYGDPNLPHHVETWDLHVAGDLNEAIAFLVGDRHDKSEDDSQSS